MTIIKIKKLNYIKLLKFLPNITLVLLLFGFISTIFFLYQYFYQTIAQVKVVSILKSQISLNQVNLPLYEKVINDWENKKRFDESSIDKIKDHFQPITTTNQTINKPTIEEVNLIE